MPSPGVSRVPTALDTLNRASALLRPSWVYRRPEVLLRGARGREGAREGTRGVARGVCRGAGEVFSRTFRLARRSRAGGIISIIKYRRLLSEMASDGCFYTAGPFFLF